MINQQAEKRIGSPQLSDALNNIKGTIWKQDDIKKRHLKFLEEQNSKKIHQSVQQHNWSIDIPNANSTRQIPVINHKVFDGFKDLNSSEYVQSSVSNQNVHSRVRGPFQYYTPRNITIDQPNVFKRKKRQSYGQTKEVLDIISQKDAQIRKLKKENHNLRNQLKIEVTQLENQSQFRLKEQQKMIDGLHLQLKQLIQPQGVTVEGRSFYAEELQRQIVLMKEKLRRSQEGNQDLQQIIASLYTCNGGNHLYESNVVAVGGSSVARAKIMQCLAIIDNQ